MSLPGFLDPKLFGVSRRDIRSFLDYLAEKCGKLGEDPYIAISRYRDVYIFANIFMKRKLNALLAAYEIGENPIDVMLKERIINDMEHFLLTAALSFGDGIQIIARPEAQKIDLAPAIMTAAGWWLMIPLTFIPMSGEMGKAVKKQIEMVGNIRSGNLHGNTDIATPFFFNDPWAGVFGYSSLALLFAIPIVYLLVEQLSNKTLLKINPLKEVELGLEIYTPLSQLTKNGLPLHTAIKSLHKFAKRKVTKRILSQLEERYEAGDLHLYATFTEQGFGREVTDTFKSIETGGFEPSKRLATAVEALEIRRLRIRKDYATLIPGAVKAIVWVVLIYVVIVSFLAYFDAFIGSGAI